ncbi:hypothetical protein [Methylocella sp.]|uniref:hypothetical protein n=1 Tax=Methylocella sp. TaxID=1978226 RepID=UPI003784EEA8
MSPRSRTSIGQPDAPQRFVGAAPDSGDGARKPAFDFARFILMVGGAYFFAPSIGVLRRLSAPVARPEAQPVAQRKRGRAFA